ncbi:MAG: M15 family metallopeptidase [Clostridia bacterium]|nr:M15 family metallopeptidase [Clostridia bacterium]
MSYISYDKNVQERIRQIKQKRVFKEMIFVLLAAVIAVCVFFGFAKDDDSPLDGILKNLREPQTTNSETTDPEEALLILVNADNPIPGDYDFKLKTLNSGEQVDERMYKDLQNMFDAMRALGIYPYINSAYRSPEKQQQLMEEKIASYENEGKSREDAERLAAQWVSEPEYSEHRIGLALDITGDTDEGTSIEEVQQWLHDFAYLYGFILRYPEDKEDITGYSYEPWHYRYVGKRAAKDMHDSGMCLEEYVASKAK